MVVSHPRRAHLDALVTVLSGLVGGSAGVETVVEAPVSALAPEEFPVVGINPKSETAEPASRGTIERDLTVTITCAGRNLAECDAIANDVEDRVDGLGAWVLVRTTFGYEGGKEVGRPFFYAMLDYQRGYATERRAGAHS
jgi:hypothetical protein